MDLTFLAANFNELVRSVGEAARQPPSPRRSVVELLIVDEADRLNMPELQTLRDRYHRSNFRDGVGLVLIGMPGLEKRLARYPQLYSRVGFVHQYRPLGSEEMGFIQAHRWQAARPDLAPDDFTDADAMAAITRITGGNFRLIQRLFAQIARILEMEWAPQHQLGLGEVIGELATTATSWPPSRTGNSSVQGSRNSCS